MFEMICPLPCDVSVPAQRAHESVKSLAGIPFKKGTGEKRKGNKPSFNTMIVGAWPPNDMMAAYLPICFSQNISGSEYAERSTNGSDSETGFARGEVLYGG